MRVFVTGASGFIGSAIVAELLGAGHQVTGLARSDAAADAVAAAGAEVHRGDLGDLDGLRRAADTADGVIHTAFIHDFSQYQAAVDTDRRAVDTLGAALAGSGRPLVVTSGMVGVASGRPGTERDLADPDAPGAPPRSDAERRTLSFAAQGVRSSVVRLPPSVHGVGDHGFVPTLIDIARATGVSGSVGDGANRWPAVHRLDAAHLYRLALEHAAAGSVLHGIADEGVPVRAIAELIGRHLGLPVVAVAPEDAAGHFGWLGAFLGADVPGSSALTRAWLEWEPTRPGLLEDLEEGHYFDRERSGIR